MHRLSLSLKNKEMVNYYSEETIIFHQAGELFESAFNRAVAAQIAINGFKANIIYPCTPDLF